MGFLATALLLAAASCVGMALFWVRQRKEDRADHVDVAWAYGVGLAAITLIAVTRGHDVSARALLVAVVVGAWSLRLGTQLLLRVRTMPEDGRYVAMKEAWGDRAWPRMFWFFQAQAAWVVLFAVPAALAAQRTGPLDRWDALAIIIAVVAIGGETIADAQLHAFRRDHPRTSVCDRGLWRWSRHPNYFFEWTYWWAYFAFSVGHPNLWGTLLGPAAMLLFLFRVTGIPWTERQALKTRGEVYRAYQETTSVFVPLPPRTPAGHRS